VLVQEQEVELALEVVLEEEQAQEVVLEVLKKIFNFSIHPMCLGFKK